MQIQLNGKPQSLLTERTLSELLERLELDPRQVVVERNKQIVSRDQFSATCLTEGDAVEILHFVGGG